MKKINFKKFLLLFCILACVFGLTACTETISSDSAKESKKEQKLAAVSTELENWSVDMIKYFVKYCKKFRTNNFKIVNSYENLL